MDLISRQLIKSRGIYTFCGGPFGLFLGACVAFSHLLRPLLILSLILGVLFFIFIIIFAMRNLSIQQESEFIDRPFPTSIDIIKMAIAPLVLVPFLYICTFFLMIYASTIKLTNPFDWFYGVITYCVLIYILDLYGVLTTQYVISNKGLNIKHGFDNITMPYSELVQYKIIEIDRISYLDTFKYRSPLTLGVRRRRLIMIKRKTTSFLAYFVQNIYLSPTDPSFFVEVVHRNIERNPVSYENSDH